jgi:CHASE3 domain sensor protein
MRERKSYASVNGERIEHGSGDLARPSRQTIDLRQNQGQAAALAVVQSDRGKQDMDVIRDQVSAMEREEIDLRAKRLAEMADAYGRAIAAASFPAFSGSASLGSLVS